MALGLRQLVNYLFAHGNEVDSTLLGIVHAGTKVGYMTKQLVLQKYGSALRLAGRYSANLKRVKDIMRGYGRSINQDIMNFGRDLDQAIDILGEYKVREVERLRKAKVSLGKAAEMLYKGYLQRAVELLEKNVFDPIKTIYQDLSVKQQPYEQLVKSTNKKEVGIGKIGSMIALLGFFSLFLYTMSPSTTGETIVFSGFNFYLIGIFSFITLIALYFIYKM